ncbi:hypothetical protein lerEdw1_012385 [Lerista edwardsae]|nr:hypothetical protein lerEdw1_012385 [Lerista edwardsae]
MSALSVPATAGVDVASREQLCTLETQTRHVRPATAKNCAVPRDARGDQVKQVEKAGQGAPPPRASAGLYQHAGAAAPLNAAGRLIPVPSVAWTRRGPAQAPLPRDLAPLLQAPGAERGCECAPGGGAWHCRLRAAPPSLQEEAGEREGLPAGAAPARGLLASSQEPGLAAARRPPQFSLQRAGWRGEEQEALRRRPLLARLASLPNLLPPESPAPLAPAFPNMDLFPRLVLLLSCCYLQASGEFDGRWPGQILPTTGLCRFGGRIDCCWGWVRHSWGQCQREYRHCWGLCLSNQGFHIIMDTYTDMGLLLLPRWTLAG